MKGVYECSLYYSVSFSGGLECSHIHCWKEMNPVGNFSGKARFFGEAGGVGLIELHGLPLSVPATRLGPRLPF